MSEKLHEALADVQNRLEDIEIDVEIQHYESAHDLCSNLIDECKTLQDALKALIS